LLQHLPLVLQPHALHLPLSSSSSLLAASLLVGSCQQLLPLLCSLLRALPRSVC
jgi:hypothetical protein